MVRHFFRANFRLLNRFRGTQYVSSTTGYIERQNFVAVNAIHYV